MWLHFTSGRGCRPVLWRGVCLVRDISETLRTLSVQQGTSYLLGGEEFPDTISMKESRKGASSLGVPKVEHRDGRGGLFYFRRAKLGRTSKRQKSTQALRVSFSEPFVWQSNLSDLLEVGNGIPAMCETCDFLGHDERGGQGSPFRRASLPSRRLVR